MQVTGAWPVPPPILCNNSPDCALTDVRSLASLLRSQRNKIMGVFVPSPLCISSISPSTRHRWQTAANCPKGTSVLAVVGRTHFTATTAAIAHVDDYQAALGLHDGRRL